VTRSGPNTWQKPYNTAAWTGKAGPVKLGKAEKKERMLHSPGDYSVTPLLRDKTGIKIY
jgi:hypothetical protein